MVLVMVRVRVCRAVGWGRKCFFFLRDRVGDGEELS